MIETPPAMYRESPHALIVRRDRSSRLAIVFPGIRQRMQGVAPLQFLKQGGLEDSNLILLRDTRRTSFLFGCSADLPTFDALLVWFAAQVAALDHVRQVVCIGVSSGLLASMVAAEHLPAACSINFGPRFQSLAEVSAMFPPHQPQPRGADPLLTGAAPIRLTAGDRVKTALLAAESRVRDAFGLAAREWSPTATIKASVHDSGPLSSRLGTKLTPPHHLYYVASNKRDRLCVRCLCEHAPNVVPHAVEPVPGCQTRRIRWDHDVVPILIVGNRLRTTIAAALRVDLKRSRGAHRSH